MTEFDPRTTAARPDLAAEALEGVVRAQRYVRPRPMQCVAPAAAIRREPGPGAEQTDQIIFGEAFEVLEQSGDWAWGQARRDGYVGWVEAAALAGPVLAPTHRVAALRTYAFPEPDIKSTPTLLLTQNALVTAEGRDGRFVRIARGGWVVESQLADFLEFETDHVAVAERYLGAPYQWGGRESVGLDCSGLVQQALYACGRACPRDADMQATSLGRAIDASEAGRGDLVFWKDHVGLLVDAERIVHANGWNMAVTIDALAAVTARAGDPVAYRRP
ncbi:MAG TPA: NlpC/P60 family protein [Caulobacteraceae bacterium]|nr:NlpC/P60 family protein [Caulobacteraceae bacterium]